MEKGGKDVEREVIQPYYEDDYQSLDIGIEGERPKLAKE